MTDFFQYIEIGGVFVETDTGLNTASKTSNIIYHGQSIIMGGQTIFQKPTSWIRLPPSKIAKPKVKVCSIAHCSSTILEQVVPPVPRVGQVQIMEYVSAGCFAQYVFRSAVAGSGALHINGTRDQAAEIGATGVDQLGHGQEIEVFSNSHHDSVCQGYRSNAAELDVADNSLRNVVFRAIELFVW